MDVEASQSAIATQQTLIFDPDVVDVIWTTLSCDDGFPTGPDQYCWGSFTANEAYYANGYSWSFNSVPQYSEEWPAGTGKYRWVDYPYDQAIPGGNTVEVATYWVQPKTDDAPGVSMFNFGFERFPSGCPDCQETAVSNASIMLIPLDPENGTFTHIGIPESFEKELVPGWNLISLPLTPVDNSTSAVLGNDTIAYDVVYRYDATAKQFECPSTMDPGIGYFVNVTTAGNWSYTGTAYTSMSVELKQGLNCIGWVNASANLPDAMSSISGDYRYVAGWDADDSKYGVYDANAPAGVPEFIDFVTMGRGNGYWIAAEEDCTLNV
jgi:hypothetical protein